MTDTVAAFLGALAETERLEPDRMRLYQRRLLDTLLRHARSETDLYRDRLAPPFRRDDSIDWDRWSEVPILARTEAQEKFDALFARSVPAHVGQSIEANTSGSTGRPFHHRASAIQHTASACAAERFLRWHRLDPAGLAAHIYAAKPDPRTRYPGGQLWSGWRLGHPDSPAATLTIDSATVAQQIEWLQRIKPAYVVSYPNNLSEIARLATESGTPLAVDAVMTFGEMTTRDAAETIRGFFGSDPLDRYGATETGIMAATCPESGLHHVMAELVLMEIIGEDGQPAKPGAAGRVVVTPFYNFAMPLIRYEIGDYAAWSPQPCACGRTLPTLAAIYGRSRNIFRFNDGSSIWPLARSRDIAPFVPHKQYQLVQVARDRLELRYVPAAADQANDLPGLADYVRRQLHPSLSVTTVAVDDIPRSKGGKYEDCISLVS